MSHLTVEIDDSPGAHLAHMARQLIDKNERQLTMLKRLEWIDGWEARSSCGYRKPNHAPDCELAALLDAAAGGKAARRRPGRGR